MKKHGIGPTSHFDCIELPDAHMALLLDNIKKDIGYVMPKQPMSSNEIMPSWSGYFTKVALRNGTSNAVTSKVDFMPIIDGGPSQPSVVKRCFDQSITIAEKLNQEPVVIVMDDAKYALGQRIRWLDPVTERRIDLRREIWLGKRFKDGGLRNIIIESWIISEDFINDLLSGKHYNRSLRTMKIFCEAIYRLLFDAFFDSLPSPDQENFKLVFSHLQTAYSYNNYEAAVASTEFLEFMTKLYVFIVEIAEANPTF